MENEHGLLIVRSLSLQGQVLYETRPDKEVRRVRSLNSGVTGDGDQYSSDWECELGGL